MRRILFLLPIAIVIAFSTLHGTSLDAKEGFIFTLPDYWIAVDETTLAEMLNNIYSSNPQVKEIDAPVYCFQLKKRLPGEKPLIMITPQLFAGKKIFPSKQVCDTINENYSSILSDTLQGTLNKICESVKFNNATVFYDHPNHIIWQGTTVNAPATNDTIVTQMASCYTAKGIIQIGLTSSLKEFETHFIDFQKAVISVVYDEDMKYKKTNLENKNNKTKSNPLALNTYLSNFFTGIFFGFLVMIGIGLPLPLILRFAIIRKPLNKPISILISIVLFFLFLFSSAALRVAGVLASSGPKFGWIVLAVVGFLILHKGYTKHN